MKMTYQFSVMNVLPLNFHFSLYIQTDILSLEEVVDS